MVLTALEASSGDLKEGFELFEDDVKVHGMHIEYTPKAASSRAYRLKRRDTNAPPTLRASEPEYRPCSTSPLA